MTKKILKVGIQKAVGRKWGVTNGVEGVCGLPSWKSAKIGVFRPSINNVQTRCIVKGEAQKSPRFLAIFWGLLIFSGAPVL